MNVTPQIAIHSNTNHFSPEFMNMLKEMMYTADYEADSYVFWEGDPNNWLYLLVEGKIKLTKLNEFGKDLTLAVHFSEDLFGEYDPTETQMNSFSAEVIEPAQVGIIQQLELKSRLKQNGNLASEFSEWQSLSRRYTQYKLRDLLLYGKNGALASTLIRAANTYGIELDGRIIITEKFTNYDLANLIGATRETVNRLLSSLKKDGLIKVAHGKIEILNLSGLKEINRCEECPVSICRL